MFKSKKSFTLIFTVLSLDKLYAGDQYHPSRTKDIWECIANRRKWSTRYTPSQISLEKANNEPQSLHDEYDTSILKNL